MNRRRIWHSVCAAICVLLAAAPAHSGAIRDFSSYVQGNLPRNDDGSAGNLGLNFEINFFGTNYSIVNVNNNGNLTFGLGNAMSSYTPFGLGGSSRPVAAGFFADVDTRNGASDVVHYGAITGFGLGGTRGTHNIFFANYIDVGYYSYQADKLNSFQILLIDRGDRGAGDFDIEYNYDRVLWETGSASGGSGGFGGSSAAMGYSNGTGTVGTFLNWPGSLVNGAFLDGGPNSLVGGQFNSEGVMGRYVFEIHNGAPIDPGSTPDYPLLPNEVVVPPAPGQPPVFQFNNPPPRVWYDPPFVDTYELSVSGGTASFLEVGISATYGVADILQLIAGVWTDIGYVSSAAHFFFPAPGVTTFRIANIAPLADAGDPFAFPVFLDFYGSTAGATFSMSGLGGIAAVPEPGSYLLFAGGLLALGLLRRRR